MRTAIFAAGCFWGVEEAFRAVEGVTDVEVGYTGGHTEDPTYPEVCNGRTGHAEAVRVLYDPDKVTYAKLLEAFWWCHDPTQLNRQGPDVGTQYRSAIFVDGDDQRAEAEASKKALDASHQYDEPVATNIEDAGVFWRAEEYHQQYLRKNGGGCHVPRR